MKIELEIVTDRRPTEDDGEWMLVHLGHMWEACHRKQVGERKVWAKMPPPPKPPIDTSLAASIERQKNKMMSIVACGNIGECKCWKCDVSRIIEAARKWDETFSNVAENALNDEFGKITSEQLIAARDLFGKRSDPDGVGEGWRKCSASEAEQWRYVDSGWWFDPSVSNDLDEPVVYRRRITSEATQ